MNALTTMHAAIMFTMTAPNQFSYWQSLADHMKKELWPDISSRMREYIFEHLNEDEREYLMMYIISREEATELKEALEARRSND